MNRSTRAQLAILMFSLPVAFAVKADFTSMRQDAYTRVSTALSTHKGTMAKVAGVILGWELAKLAYRKWIAPRASRFFHGLGDWFGQEHQEGDRRQPYARAIAFAG